MKYYAKIKEEGKYWTVEFNDCPGCQTFGESYEEALEMAKEALEGWLESYLTKTAAPPKPKTKKGTPIEIDAMLAMALNVRWSRTEANLSQASLAKKMGVSQQQVAKLENPKNNTSIRTLSKFASAIGASLDISVMFQR